jgi:hypothetical protein
MIRKLRLHVRCPVFTKLFDMLLSSVSAQQPRAPVNKMSVDHSKTSPSIPHGHPLPTLLIYTLTPVSLALIAQPLLPVVLSSRIIAQINLPTPHAFPALQACLGFSLLAFVGAVTVIPRVSQPLVQRGLSGRDLLKAGGRISGPIMYVYLIRILVLLYAKL